MNNWIPGISLFLIGAIFIYFFIKWIQKEQIKIDNSKKNKKYNKLD